MDSRIKCDEGKPNCNNCIKAHRECEGYKQRLDFRDGLAGKQRSVAEEGTAGVGEAPFTASVPMIRPSAVPADPQVFHNSQDISPSLAQKDHVSPDLPIYLSPSGQRSRSFTELFNHVAAMNRSSELAFYKPTATNSPLMVDKVYFLFDYFVRNFGSGMSIVARNKPNHGIPFIGLEDRRGLEDFWTHDAPLMALGSPHILNAMLALASLHYSRVFGGSNNDGEEFNSMTYYQNAVIGLREDIALQRFPDSLATLTTCLLLAFYETMYGDLVKWYQHMTGARDIINALNVKGLAECARDIYTNGVTGPLTQTEISALQACDLLALFLHMEVIQSSVGHTQLMLEKEFWDDVPLRTLSDPIIYAYDVLLRTSVNICSWVSKDTERKGRLYPKDQPPLTFTKQDQAELEISRAQWNQLKADLTNYEELFSHILTPLPLTGPPTLTPFGPLSSYSSSYALHLATTVHMNWLIVKRANPDVPASGFNTLRYTAQEGVPNVLAILRSIPPSFPFNLGHIGSESLDDGQIVRLATEMCMPVFFASVQIRDPIQQEWIGNWYEDCFKFTGWDTARTIIRGIRNGWEKARVAMAQMSGGPPDAAPAVAGAAAAAKTTGPTPGSSPAGSTSEGESPNSIESVSSSDTPPDSEHEPVFTKNELRAQRVATAKGIL